MPTCRPLDEGLTQDLLVDQGTLTRDWGLQQVGRRATTCKTQS
jgi:hypothetical protein